MALRIALVVPVLPTVARSLELQLERNRTSIEHAEALARLGVEVHLLVPSHEAATATLPSGSLLHYVPVRHQRTLALELGLAVRRIEPDLVHAFHFRYLPMLASLLATGQRVVGEYNGGSPPEAAWKRLALGQALSRCAALCFTSIEQAQPFRALARFEVLETPEISARLEGPGDRALAKRRARMDGNPQVLVVARLEPPKDPWCTLSAFERILAERPGAKLLWLDSNGRDRPAIEEAIRARGLGQIEIREGLGRQAMVDAYDAADVMLHTSRREIFGHAYVEALSMGVPIAASDIPAFRRWHPAEGVTICPVGDAAAFASAALALGDRSELRPGIRAYFERELSYDAIARRRLELYQRLF